MKSQDSISKRFGRFLRHIVAARNCTMLMTRYKHMSMARRASRLRQIVNSIKRDSWQLNLWFPCHEGFECIQIWVSSCETKVEAITVNDHIHKIWIVKCWSRGLECRFREMPVWRPLTPQPLVEVSTMKCQTLSTTFNLEEMLIPH